MGKLGVKLGKRLTKNRPKGKVEADLKEVVTGEEMQTPLLPGKGVEVNHTAAMEWFKKAADQGHPQAAYNVAIGHLQGHTTGLKPGDAYRLIKQAASQGLPEAVEVLEKVCSRGHCDV